MIRNLKLTKSIWPFYPIVITGQRKEIPKEPGVCLAGRYQMPTAYAVAPKSASSEPKTETLVVALVLAIFRCVLEQG